jgi:orotidine-5'-phosphate decarboxylase
MIGGRSYQGFPSNIILLVIYFKQKNYYCFPQNKKESVGIWCKIMSKSFREKIETSLKKKRSNVIVALDPVIDDRDALLKKSLEIVHDVAPYVCAVKFNHHLILPLGLYHGVQRIIDFAHDLDLPTIMDCKINDIGDTNEVIARLYFEAGFDAVIANSFVGWEDGLKPIFELARKLDRGVILLVYMSHKGADEGYGQKVINQETGESVVQYKLFASKALKWGADGAVVGATYPDKVREIKEILGDKVPIYSPGIGAQGGSIEQAVKAGTRYLIIGRAIFQSEDSAASAKAFRDMSSKFLS